VQKYKEKKKRFFALLRMTEIDSGQATIGLHDLLQARMTAVIIFSDEKRRNP